MKTAILILVLVTLCSQPSSGQLTYGTEVTGNLILPTSSFADAFTTGYGGTLGMYFDMEPNIRVTLSGGYLSNSVDASGIQDLYTQAGGSGTINPSGSTKTIPLLVGLQLITPGPLRMYGGLEAGIYVYNVSVDAVITDNTGSANVKLADDTRTEFGVNAGFGALFPLRKDMSFTAGVKYHFVKTSEFRSTSGGASNLTLSTNQFLSLALGLNWSFPT